jgi:hypothetical protein
MMDEQVRAVVGGDKTETLGIIEPLHFASCHFLWLLLRISMSDSRALLIQADFSAPEVVSFKWRLTWVQAAKEPGATPNSPAAEEHFLNDRQPAI